MSIKCLHRHCATHQIRIILVSCVVITSLFYPALDLYYSSASHIPYLSYLSYVPSFYHPIFSSLVPKARQGDPSLTSAGLSDLQDIWTPHASLRVQDDAVSRANCRRERSIRVERLFIQSPPIPGDDNDGALNQNILLSTFEIENRLDAAIAAADLDCLRYRPGQTSTVAEDEKSKCLVVSPLAFWNYDLSSLRADTGIIDTLNGFRNVSVARLPVTPQMVVAGRGSDGQSEPLTYAYDYPKADFDYAAFVALTYFFPETDCLGNTERALWLQVARQAMGDVADVVFHPSEPSLRSLQFTPEHSKGKHIKTTSLIKAFIYLAYMFFSSYVTWSMRRMKGVHSRIGLTFTALVEIAVSTITSLSVCALVGFKITMVPWELLPMIIVFVGAENMVNLVDAVTKTPITLSVRQRIAQGLARAGTSNTLKVVSYNAILGVISVFSYGAIRQFCAFAVVVLVAHWFLAHTFFLAVLSIDLQRLELDELLKQNPSLAPAGSDSKREKSVERRSMNKWQRFLSLVQQALRGRARTNLSLLLLLATTAALYYTTYASSRWKPVDPAQTAVPRPNALARDRTAEPSISPTEFDPAFAIWNTLNPNGDPLLHLRIESPAMATLKGGINHKSSVAGDSSTRADGRKTAKSSKSRVVPSLSSILWLLKIVVFPITATTGALYGLLLYLLKDAELLDAQRNRAESDGSTDGADPAQISLDKWVRFLALPRGMKADIVHVSASLDGRLVVTSSIQNEVVIWYQTQSDAAEAEAASWSRASLDVGRAVSNSAPPSSGGTERPMVRAVAADTAGRYFAVGTGEGFICIWEWVATSNRTRSGPNASQIACVELPAEALGMGPVAMGFRRTSAKPALLFSFADGQLFEWSGGTTRRSMPTNIQASYKATLVPVRPDGELLVAFCMDDGSLEVLETGASYLLLTSPFITQAGSPGDPVMAVDACCLEINGCTRLVIAAATLAGTISLWDGSSGECINVLDDVFGSINTLRISPIPSERCPTCSELPPESFALTFSRDQVVHFFTASLPTSLVRRCVCLRSQLRHTTSWDNQSLGRRSRNGSVSSVYMSGGAKANGSASNGGSPLMSRQRLPTPFEVSPFPVSGHGVHSRKASEKDSSRRLSDVLAVPPLAMEDLDPIAFNSSGETLPSGSSTPSTWHGVIVIRSFADITCERGCWGVLDGKIVGIRRRPRPGNASGNATARNHIAGEGLSPATLDRWELWMWDPRVCHLQCSPLASLTTEVTRETRRSDSIPRLPFTRVAPLVCTRSYALAGFGNTFGVVDFSSRYC
ncbi:hypothetical protein HGRIS_013584 [Hohenbuehelia grisea]|uniref:Sterol regulatory element-binding protein cleavage-activating protein n=1 Tax=Hohenbuehelia grisea TaxID=104357 RepID=A0ABR3IVV1_9AGAR